MNLSFKDTKFIIEAFIKIFHAEMRMEKGFILKKFKAKVRGAMLFK